MSADALPKPAPRARPDDMLDAALDCIEREVPDRLARAVRWLRDPQARWFRLPIGVLFVIASFFWFLPVIGIEFLPIGLLLLAIDVPWLRRPVGSAVLWLARLWRRVRRRWSR